MFFLIFIFLPFFIFSENMEVFLKTKNPVYPVFLSKVYKESFKGEGINLKYTDRLKKVLEFDLENSGYCSLVLEDEILSDKVENFNEDFWKKEPFKLIIKLIIDNKTLKIYTYDKKSYRLFKEIDILGNLKEDRKKIHKLSDDILFIFFNKKSIASKKILFTKKINDISEVWISDYDGENQKQLTFENSYAVHPIHIEKDDFIYVSYKTGIPKIYYFKDKKSIPFISLRGNQLLPSLNKDFTLMTFISDVAGRSDLFCQKIKDKKPFGKPSQIFTCENATEAGSSISLDNQTIAFVSDKDRRPMIYLKTKDKIIPFNKQFKESVCPAFSKDGTKLAYSAKIDDFRQIFVYDFILDVNMQLTFSPINKENPCWAEDNLHIIYNTENKKEADLYLIDLNRKKPIKISKDRNKDRFAFWIYK